MVIRVLSFAVALVAVALLALVARAGEPTKSECPKECEMRARAAFAFAKEKAKAEAKAATTTAPAPAPKVPGKKVGRGCSCNDDCHCEPGDCPSKCPVSALKTLLPEAAKGAGLAPAAVTPAKRIVGYSCGTDQYGRRVCVPVYSDDALIPVPSGVK